MKYIIPILIALLTSELATAQLYAENDSYIFSRGTNIFVKQEVNLTGTTAMYMRGESQLMQEDNVDNLGSGFISLYQEGDANEFTYNYWSSPVSSEDTGTDGNVGFSRTILHYPITGGFNNDFVRDAGDAVFLPVPNYDGVADDGTSTNPLEIAGYWLWNFDSSGNTTAGYAGWIPFQDDVILLEPGYGFTMKGIQPTPTSPNYREFNGETGQRYDLRGRANNGTINVGVANDRGTLAGNPYPSALDLKRFLQENSEHTDGAGNDVKIDPEVQFWESQPETSHQLVSYLGGYGVYVPLGFDPGSEDGFDNSGAYNEAIFARYDTNGEPITSTAQTGGSTVDGGRRYAAVGQGFFINRTNTAIPSTESTFQRTATEFITDGVFIGSDGGTSIIGEEAEFNNSMRVWQKENGTTSVFKNGEQIQSTSNGLKLMTLNVVHRDLYVRPLKFVFSPQTSLAYDHAWEGMLNNRQGNDAYINVDGIELSLSSQAFDQDLRIPLGVEVRHENGDARLVEFEMGELLNFDPSEVYIYDKQTETYYDVKNENQFILLEPNHYLDRFELTFNKNSTLSNEDLDLSGVVIYQNNDLKELKILNPNMLDVRNITIYDLAGRVVTELDKRETESNYTVETGSFTTGIYIARVTTKDDAVKAIKVSIDN